MIEMFRYKKNIIVIGKKVAASTTAKGILILKRGSAKNAVQREVSNLKQNVFRVKVFSTKNM